MQRAGGIGFGVRVVEKLETVIDGISVRHYARFECGKGFFSEADFGCKAYKTLIERIEIQFRRKLVSVRKGDAAGIDGARKTHTVEAI